MYLLEIKVQICRDIRDFQGHSLIVDKISLGWLNQLQGAEFSSGSSIVRSLEQTMLITSFTHYQVLMRF